MKATLYLGPKDGQELTVSAADVKAGVYTVTGTGRHNVVLTGTYRLKVAPDGLAVLDTKRRLTFEWDGWKVAF